ncbi:MAG TPA: hypothetical protein VMV95_04240 [Bacillota bacterium]|nr:hypothetical protein [Bacillota bacterium]
MDWDTIAKLGLVLVIIYLIAKALGIINSPPAVDVGAIVAGGIFVWRYATKIDEINKDINELTDVCPNLKKRKK